jgi:hypothetical protein
MHVTAEAKNPASCVTAGIARMPAPTYSINIGEKKGQLFKDNEHLLTQYYVRVMNLCLFSMILEV